MSIGRNSLFGEIKKTKHSKQLSWLRIILCICFGVTFINSIYTLTDTEVKDYYICSTDEAIPEAKVISGENGLNITQVFKTEYKKLNSLELIFTNIPEDTSGTISMSIESETGIFYQTNISISKLSPDSWYRILVNIPIEKGRPYKIRLVSDTGVKVPELYSVNSVESAPESIVSYVNGEKQSDQQILLRYGYLKEVTNLDRIVLVIIYLMIYGVLIWLFLQDKKITLHLKKNCKDWIAFCRKRYSDFYGIIIGLILCYGTIEYSGIPLQICTRIVFYMLTIWSVYKVKDKVQYARVMARKVGKNRMGASLIVLILYAGFALVGNRMFLYPITLKVTLGNILVYIMASIWMTPIILSILFLFGNITIQGKKYLGRSTVCFSLIVGLILVIPLIFSLYAFNPGFSSPDSVVCMWNAHHIWQIPDWHSPFYCIILKLIIEIWDSTYAVILVQWMFYVYVILQMLLFARKRGVNEKLLYVIAISIGCNACNILSLSGIWKDFPYMMAILWLTVSIGKIVVEYDVYIKKWYIYLELIAALVLTALLRQNGIVPYLCTVIAMLMLYKNRKVIVSLGISVMLVLLIKGPVYSYIDVQPAYDGGAYIGLSQDILGVYYAGGDLSEDSLKMIKTLTTNNMSEYIYNPYRARSSYDLDVKPLKFIINYINTYIRNPVIMTRAILCRQDGIWDIFEGQDSIEYLNLWLRYMDENASWSEYYPRHKDNILTALITEKIQDVTSNQILYVLLFRPGIWLLIALIALQHLMIKRVKRKSFLVYVPLIGHIIGLILSTGWNDQRYYWPIYFMSLFIILLALTIDEPQVSSDRKKYEGHRITDTKIIEGNN